MHDLATALVAASPEAVLVSNGTGRILAANPAAAALTGYPLDTLVGLPLAELVDTGLVDMVQRTVHADSLPIDRARLPNCHLRTHNGTPRRVDARIARLDLDCRPCAAMYLRPIRRDPTADELITFRHLLDAVIADQDLTEILDMAVRGASQVFDADGVSVMRHDPQSNSVEVVAACGSLAPYLGTLIRLPGTRIDIALQQGAPVHYVDGGLLRQRNGETYGPVFGEVWLAPITVDTEPFGILAVTSRAGHLLAGDTEHRLGAFIEVLTLGIEITEANRHRSALAVVADHERIARDLHDVVIQRLIAAAMNLESLSGRVDDTIRSRLGRVIDDLDRVSRDIRSTVFHLQRDDHAHRTIAYELRDLARVTAESFGLQATCTIEPASSADLPNGLRSTLLAVTREALSNVGRHSHATSVHLEVDLGNPLVLTVTDDGCGLPPEAQPGNGLRNLATRAEELGGLCTLTSAAPQGTMLRWEVPWPLTTPGQQGLAANL